MSSNAKRAESWTVAEAKSRLSEVLRLASETPQYIGAKRTHVVVLAEDWERAQQPQVGMGLWLVNAVRGSGDLSLPDRAEPGRDVPFDD